MREAIAVHGSADRASATIARTPHSRKWNSSSASLNAGLSGTTTAPARRTARKATAKAGTFGQHQRHRVAGGDAARGQRAGQPLHPLVQLAVGDPLVAVDERHAIREGGRARVEHLRDRRGWRYSVG